MKKLMFFIVFLSLINCKNETNKAIDGVIKKHPKTEIITRTYAVKQEGNERVKDTINMMQSLIVDETGKELTNIFYNLNETVNWRDEYKYDARGRKIGSRFFDNGLQTSYYEYDLDDQDRKIGFRAKDIKTDTLLYDGASLFEDNGKLRKDGYINKEGEFKWNYEYYFDSDGKELGYTYISSKSGSKFFTSYEYVKFNEDNKWITRNIIKNNTVINIETREFKIIED